MHLGRDIAALGIRTAGRTGDGNSADCAHRFLSAERLLVGLEVLDILMEGEGDQLTMYLSEAEIGDDLLALVRGQKPGDLQLLRSETPVHRGGDLRAQQGWQQRRPRARQSRASSSGRWWLPGSLAGEPEGLQCSRCGRLAWAEGEDGSLTRADMLDVDLVRLSPDEIDQCLSCGDLCDTDTGMGDWACSRCDPLADSRRRTSSRVLSLRQKLLAEHRRFAKVSRGT